MDRRSFLVGLAATPFAAAIPTLASEEPIFVGIDWGAGDDFTAFRRFQIDEICRWFAVPRELIAPSPASEGA